MSFQKIEWTDDVIEEFWRYWSQRPSAYFTEALGDTIVRYASEKLSHFGACLDFGAGTGGLLAALSRQGHKAYGLDFGDDTTAALAARFADDSNIGGILQIDDLAEHENYFDTIFLIETIEHMPDRHLHPSIAAIHKALKPGGALFVSTPNDEDLAAAEIYCPVSKVVFHPMQHLRSWDATSLSAYLSDAGFASVKCHECDLQAQPYHSKSEWLKRMLKQIVMSNYKDPHLVAVARK